MVMLSEPKFFYFPFRDCCRQQVGCISLCKYIYRMKNIKCPNCGTVFKVDESDYAAIVSQVRNSEFDDEIKKRIEELNEKHAAQEKAAAAESQRQHEKTIADKERELANLEKEIQRLKGIIDNNEDRKKAELAVATAESNRKLAELKADKEKAIAKLKTDIATSEKQHELDILAERNAAKDELYKKDETIAALNLQMKAEQAAAKNKEIELKEHHANALRGKQEEIDRLKDFKSRLSTKMLGESLEQHCAISFAHMQSMGMFPDAFFDKDNDIKTGTKGDFIFRDFFNGFEYVSVMFEMKNEADTTATKHKNTDFLEKLDKDRREKNCEYAILVSMLEQDNPLYDNGIVDFSHLYPKMMVIRPQFFIPILRILTQSSSKNLRQIIDLRQQLDVAQAQSLDVTKLMQKVEKFRNAFGKNLQTAQAKYEAAMTGIDKIIANLEKQISDLRAVKANFETSEQRLLKANEVLEEDFTIKKLTHGNPTMRAKLEEAAKSPD